MSDSDPSEQIRFHPYGEIEETESQIVLRFHNRPATPPVDRLPEAEGHTTFEVRNADIQDLERLYEALGAFIDDYYSVTDQHE